MKKEDFTIDIIIPIYNALDDLKKCVDSVIKNTDLKNNRLILVNDKSPDINVGKYLETINNKENVCVIENAENMGFSASINKGILLSETHDVILLNSDVIVTPKWVENLKECAYSDVAIATVTPMSNNASICSVPVSDHDNRIPDNMTLDEYAFELERVSLQEYPTIPMGVGFCMYIKRSVIREVGLFDDGTFGKGYGEENDYCNRATELGYRHVLCDNVFIYHKGTASFNEQIREKLGIEHEPILEERYPQLNRKLEWYWAYEQNTRVHKNVDLYTKLKLVSNKKNILYLLQADFQEGCSNNIGGTQLHVKDLVETLNDEYNFFVVARDEGMLRVTAYIEKQKIVLSFPIGAVPPFPIYRDKTMFGLYENLLKAFKIDLVHIHHTMGMTLEMYYAANKYGIPIYVTLHDYYYICPTLRLLDAEKKSCIGKKDWKKCQECMKANVGVYEGVPYIPKWRLEHEKVLEMCEKVIVPSQSAADIILNYYPKLREKIKIIYHGIDTAMFFRENCPVSYNHKKLHVAFVGGICETKGSEVIYNMISECKKDYKWYIFGGVDGKKMIDLKQSNLVKTGWYKRDELKSLLKKYEIDVVCILSKVAETYCYTLSEVVACGVPVIVTDIGALGERVCQMNCGWTVPSNASHEIILTLLDHICNNSSEYEEKLSTVNSINIRSVKEMAEDYRAFYEKIEKIDLSKTIFNAGAILEGYILAENEPNAKLPASSIDELIAQNKRLESELQMIYDSEIFKIMKKMASIIDWIKGAKS